VISLNINHYDIKVTRHAFIRAHERQITPDMIYATVRGGKIKRFGKNNYKFYRRYKRFTVVCVDQIYGDKIVIATVETKGA